MLEVNVGVRELALFVHRRGDIHYRYDRSTSAEEGISAQRRYQKSRHPIGPSQQEHACEDYQREYAVSETITTEGGTNDTLTNITADGDIVYTTDTINTNTVGFTTTGLFGNFINGLDQSPITNLSSANVVYVDGDGTLITVLMNIDASGFFSAMVPTETTIVVSVQDILTRGATAVA